MAIAELCSRWFGELDLSEEGGFFENIARELGFSQFQSLRKLKTFELWYEIARYAFEKESNIEKIMLSRFPDPESSYYLTDWSGFPESTNPAGEWTESKAEKYASTLKSDKGVRSRRHSLRDHNVLFDIGTFALDRIWGALKDEEYINCIEQAREDVDSPKVEAVIDRACASEPAFLDEHYDFKQVPFAFAAAAFYLSNALTQHTDEQTFREEFEKLLQASRRAVPSRYALMITLLQTSSKFCGRIRCWRDELVTDVYVSSLRDGKKKLKYLQLLTSLTALLLDSGNNIQSAADEIVERGMEAKLDTFLPDIALQLGKNELQFYVDLFNRSSSEGKKNCVRAICILRETGENADVPIMLNSEGYRRIIPLLSRDEKTDEDIISSLKQNSKSDLDHWLQCLLVIPSGDQSKVLYQMVFKKKAFSGIAHERAIIFLLAHPIPKLTLDGLGEQEREKWLDILKERYANSAERIDSYIKNISDDLSSEEKERLRETFPYL